MELRHLRYFAAVADTCHFGRAAEQLLVAQPALSYAIRQLEDELDATLFNRTTRQVSLTPAGEFLKAEAARILAGVDDAERGVRRIAAGRSGLLRVGLTGTAASPICRASRASFVRNFLAWRWRSRRTCSRPQQCEQLRTGALDVGVLRPPAVGDDIELRSIDVEPLVLAVSADHRLAAEPVVSLTDLRSESFVAYASRDSAVNDAVLRSCKRAGFVPHREHAAPGTAVLLALVAAGFGVAVVPPRYARCHCRAWSFVIWPTAEASNSPWPGDAAVTTRSSMRSSTSCPRFRAGLRAHRCGGAAMKITAVEAIPFAIPYVKPLKFASGEVHTADHVLVRVHTDDGVVGVAEAPPRPFTYGETQAGIVAVIEQLFAPALVGLTLTEREVAGARLARTVGNPAAKSAVDMAIWDALGRTLELPVTSLLGGYTDRMRVSHMLGFDEPAAMVAEAEKMRDLYGITTFKVKVGRRPVTLDTAVVRALRDHFGDSVELYVDANRGWTRGGVAAGHAGDGRPRPALRRGAVPRR